MTTFTLPTARTETSLVALVMAPFRPRKRRALLDPRDLPDHLKRDIGVLDGHEIPAGDRRA